MGKKIIHMSDLHIGYKDFEDRFNNISDNIIKTLSPSTDYVIVITGDIVDNANDENSYKNAYNILEKLRSAGYEVLVVPGNHDYGSGIVSNRRYVDKFKEVFYGNSRIKYPKTDIIENTAFIGLDSMAEELHWYDKVAADGQIGTKQIRRLIDLLQNESSIRDAEYRVLYYHHHPFAKLNIGRKLKDRKALKKALKPFEIDAMLFGHNHNFKMWNGWQWNINRCYDAGSTTGKRGHVSPLRIIDLSKDLYNDQNVFMLI